MATLIQQIPAKSALSARSVLWLVAFGTLATLLALLTKAIMDNPAQSLDIETMDWIVGWEFWGVTKFLGAVSAVTDAEAGVVYVVLGIGFLLLLGKTRPAIVFTTVRRGGGDHLGTGIAGLANELVKAYFGEQRPEQKDSGRAGAKRIVVGVGRESSHTRDRRLFRYDLL